MALVTKEQTLSVSWLDVENAIKPGSVGLSYPVFLLNVFFGFR